MPRRRKIVSRNDCSLLTKEGPINYTLKRSYRRTLAITINDKAQVIVGAPAYVLERDIEKFLHEKADWIVRSIQTTLARYHLIQSKQYAHGHEFLFLGQKYPIHISETSTKRGKVNFVNNTWNVEVAQGLSPALRERQVKGLLTAWYRGQAEEILGAKVFAWARQVGVAPQKLAIRTQKRVWGNCHFRTQTIHLNWQIILSPPEVIDYVIVHELCHLMIPNHSKRFWKKVEAIMPDFNVHRKWLRVNSADMVLP